MYRPIGILIFAIMAVVMVGCDDDEPVVHSLDLVTDNAIPWDGSTPALLYVDGDTLPAAVHYRGGFSRRYPKHSMALRLARETTLCGLPEDKRFILNASYADRSFLRHRLSFDLFRSFGDNVAPECAYVKLSVNGEPQGLYVLMQRMDATTLGIDKQDTDAVVFKEPFLFGYRQRYDGDNPYAQKYPDIDYEDHSVQYEQLQDLIFDTLTSDYYHVIDSAIDIRNVADWHIILLLTNNIDGIVKGFYLYKAGGYAKWRFALWDYDHAFGRDGDGEPNMLERKVDVKKNVMFRNLMKNAEYRSLLRERYWQHRQGSIDANALKCKVKGHAKNIGKAVKDDIAVWPNDTAICPYHSTLQDEVDVICQFIDLNIPRLDSIFK